MARDVHVTYSYFYLTKPPTSVAIAMDFAVAWLYSLYSFDVSDRLENDGEIDLEALREAAAA